MTITKKSLLGKTSTNNFAKSKTASVASTSAPVTPGKMVPAMRLAKAQLKTSKVGMQTGMIARF
jgi:hypothetical protein